MAASRHILFDSSRDALLCLDAADGWLALVPLAEVLQRVGRFNPLTLARTRSGFALRTARGGGSWLQIEEDGTARAAARPTDLAARSANKALFLLRGTVPLLIEPSGRAAFRRAGGVVPRLELLSGRKLFDHVDAAQPNKAPGGPAKRQGRVIQTNVGESYGRQGLILANARVLATDWAVVAEGNLLLRAEMSHIQRSSGVEGERADILYPRPERSVEAACLIGGYYNLYHHLLDYAVNVFAVGDVIGKDVPLLTCEWRHPFQRGIFEMFGIDRGRCIELPVLSSIKVGSLVVPQKGNSRRWSCRQPTHPAQGT